MKTLCHEGFAKKRIDKIVNILGEDWFPGKNILELGCNRGDIGIALLKLGARVMFIDGNLEFIYAIKDRLLQDYQYNARALCMNLEQNCHFGEKFDLVVHMGLLYHLPTGWRQSLRYSMEHSNLMILESRVPDKKRPYTFNNLEKFGEFSEEAIESELASLGCKFLKITDSSLNHSSWHGDIMMHHVYDWDEDTSDLKKYNGAETATNLHLRRMWLVIK